MIDTTLHLSPAWLAAHIDISCVQAYHARADIDDLAHVAMNRDFVSAHVLPHWLETLKTQLAGSPVLAGAPVGFPSGGALRATKVAEARALLKAGAQELDVVANVGRLKSADDGYVLDELREIVELVSGAAPLRVILELAYLSPDEVARGCELAVRAGADYVKTGTGWTGRATTVADIEAIAARVQGAILIKAAGGIRSLDQIQAMTALGVTRFGVNATTAQKLLDEASDIEGGRS